MKHMPTFSSNPSTLQVEKAFLRKAWWIFPVLGALASLAIGGPFWAWMHGLPIVIRWLDLFSLRTAFCAGAFLCIPAIWWLGLRAQRNGFFVAGMLLLLVMGADVFSRTSWAQTAMWLCARQRLRADQFFMRETCYIQLEEIVQRKSASSSVLLVGSSQMLHGVERHLLGELLQPVPVIRRAVFGMTPLKALAMRSTIPFQTGNICVLYLSEFDFTNQDKFPFAWFRPFASWKTLPDILACTPPLERFWRGRQIADYALAASTEWWKARDFIQQIVFCISGISRKVSMPSESISKSDALVKTAKGALLFSEAEWRAFQRFAQLAREQGVELVVFEGDVNPKLYSESRIQHKEEVRKRISDYLASGYGRYVSLEEQGLELSADDWLDMTHLNAKGAEKLTRRVAQELLSP